jgi:hypothetical protein
MAFGYSNWYASPPVEKIGGHPLMTLKRPSPAIAARFAEPT